MIIEEDGVLVSQATKDGYAKCKWGGVVDISYPNSKTRRGRVEQNGDICPTLTTSGNIVRIELWNI